MKVLVDVGYVIGVDAEGLDWAYLESWCKAHGTQGLLAEMRSQIPPDVAE